MPEPTTLGSMFTQSAVPPVAPKQSSLEEQAPPVLTAALSLGYWQTPLESQPRLGPVG